MKGKEKGKMRVLLLGPTGRIGKYFREDYFTHGYNKDYELILGVRDKTKIQDSRFEIRFAEISNLDSLKEAMKGVDIVLNLAANSNPEAEFRDLIEPNLIGTFNILEAARLMNVKRVIMASSIHAVKGHDEDKVVKEIDAPRPLNYYGATKAFVEAMCHVFYKKYGMSCFAIRIGAYVSDDMRQTVCFTRDNYDYVISQRDMAQLFHKAIIAPLKIKYAVFSGSSDNKKKRLDLEFTKKTLGYKPEDDAYELCEECKKIVKETTGGK